MSLFGSSPPEEPSQSARAGKSQSLFDDERTTGAADSSIFDDGDGSAPSPWEMPTPKKPAKGDMVKTLLPASSVPDSYIDAFDTILDSGYALGPSSITIEGATKLLEGSGLDADEQASIVSLVTGGQEPSGGLGRNEFNVFVALAGLAQEHDEATLDGVDERRRSMTTCCPWPATNNKRRLTLSRPTRTLSPSHTADEDSQSIREHRRRLPFVARHPSTTRTTKGRRLTWQVTATEERLTGKSRCRPLGQSGTTQGTYAHRFRE